jgi:type II secretory pathway pseudopilin PulG
MSSLSQLDRSHRASSRPSLQADEAGFMLLAVVVMVALVLIALSAAAPVIARQLRRDKEIESQHRMEEYVRAIQLYQRKLQQYPPSIKALENTNNVRFLRHVYIDPLTGKADYKLIHQGEQKTKIHVFFGQELAGLAASLGSAANMQSSGGMGVPAGGSSTSTIGATSPLASGFSGASITTGASGSTGASGGSGASGDSGSTGTSAFGDGTIGVIVGVGTSRSGNSVTEPNGQTTYETWEFWYDPRIEMLKQGVNITGGGMSTGSGMSSQSATGFGQNAVTGQPDSGATGSTGSNGSSGTTGSTGSTSPFSSPYSNPF